MQRVTRGKMIRFNFGATVHRVVRLDIADGVFEPETTELRLQWAPRITQLVNELQKAPSVLRLSYVADTEQEALVKQRVEAFTRLVTDAWNAQERSYRLTIEPEILWRRGGPPGRPDKRDEFPIVNLEVYAMDYFYGAKGFLEP